ncbi:1-acylglycerol-3-phosphate O-acyltransferase [Ascosphaera aggregata]|nr:1-acylglycerol-3-phosphate O-acyltransferase [Ascosphaera aggregata]
MSLCAWVVTGLTSYVVLVVSMYGLSLVYKRAAFFARCLAAYGCLAACASYGVIASIVLRLVGYGGISQWTVARAFKWTMWFATGVWFEIVEGAEHLATRPAVFIGNHQTELDILLLGAIFPQYCSVTAKKSLKYVPCLGWFMALSGTVFLDRANRTTALQAMSSAVKEIKHGRQSVYLFPEGTRSYSSEPVMLPFKKGAFHLAQQAGVPIIPLVAENYSHVLHIKQRTFNSGVIRVKVLPPVPTDNLTPKDIDGIVQSTRDSMLKVLVEMYKTRDDFVKSGRHEKVNTPEITPETTATASGVDANSSGADM